MIEALINSCVRYRKFIETFLGVGIASPAPTWMDSIIVSKTSPPSGPPLTLFFDKAPTPTTALRVLGGGRPIRQSERVPTRGSSNVRNSSRGRCAGQANGREQPPNIDKNRSACSRRGAGPDKVAESRLGRRR